MKDEGGSAPNSTEHANSATLEALQAILGSE